MVRTIFHLASEPDKIGWENGFLTLCRDICGTSQDEQLPEEETPYPHRARCPVCGNLVSPHRVEGHTEWEDCENCRLRVVTREDQLLALMRTTRENVRYLFGVEIEGVLIAKREFLSRFSGKKKRQRADETFHIDSLKPNGREKEWKHVAILMGSLPDAVIVAEVVRYLCSMFLKQGTQRLEYPEGLAEWFKVHYIFLIDRKDYARRVDNSLKLDSKAKEGYQFWTQKLDSPLNTRIISMSHALSLAQEWSRQEKFAVSQEDALSEVSKRDGVAPGTDDQESK